MRKRIIFDLLLTIVLVFEVLHQLTGNTLHEIVGIAFFVCIIVHLSFASRWIRDTVRTFGKGELSSKQRRLAIVAILLAVDTLVLLISSIIISELLWNVGVDLTWLNPGKIWYPIHTVAAYTLCILVLGHLVMHWASVVNVLGLQYDPSRRDAISQALNGVVMIGGIALGITGIARAGFQASDYSVVDEQEAASKTVESGYREKNAQTGEYVSTDALGIASLENDGEAASQAQDNLEESVPTCPICPRQCKLSSPRCNRPYEAGLIPY